MQLNKVLKGLLLALPIIAVAACSSNKNKDQAGTDTSIMPTDTSTSSNSNAGLSSEDMARQQMQELQNQNVVYFGLDQYNISPEYAELLDKHAAFLRNNPSVRIVVEGHADERGTPEYNISLGERRASAAKMYLQSKGVSADQMSIVSYGKEKPAVLGHTEADYAKNRRAVLAY